MAGLVGKAVHAGAAAAGGPEAKAMTALAQSVATFGTALLHQLPEGASAFVSPYSIVSALALAMAGAHGNTRDEMMRVLAVSDVHAFATALGHSTEVYSAPAHGKRAYSLETFNHAYVEEAFPLEPAYVALTRDVMKCAAIPSAFRKSAEEVRQRINKDVEKQTHGMIKDLLPSGSLDALVRLVLVNTVYFKGTWKTKFDVKDTQPGSFRGLAGETSVPMMSRTLKRVQYRRADLYSVLQLEYAGDEVVMDIFLPHTPADYRGMRSALLARPVSEWVGTLRTVDKVELRLPRFTFETPSLRLKPALTAMGIRDAFSDASDFSLMSKAGELFIDEVYHKAKVIVDESGTEAEAATAVVMKLRSEAFVREEVVQFFVEHPFMFVIRDVKANVPLFVGQVTDL